MARAPRICNQRGCGKAVTRSGRCPKHAAELDEHQRRTTPTKVGLTYAERKRRAAVIAAWRSAHGDLCPGYKRPPHPANNLTAEHLTPVGDGGDQSGPLSVLCRSCNSRGGAELANRYRDS